MDRTFEPARDELALLKIGLNTVAEGNRVPEIERLNRTIKEMVCASYNELKRNLNKLSVVLIIYMVYAAVLWINSFPSANGISTTIIPQSILMGMNIRFSCHFPLYFGQYVHTHEDVKKLMKPQTLEALSLRPTGNYQGSQYFLNLQTGFLVTQYKWTVLSMPTRIKNVFCRMAHRYSIRFDITDERGNKIIYYNPSNNFNSNYDPAFYYNRTYDPAPSITNYDNIVDTYDLNYDDDDIIINPDFADHHGLIAVVATNHYHNLTDNPTHKT